MLGDLNLGLYPFEYLSFISEAFTKKNAMNIDKSVSIAILPIFPIRMANETNAIIMNTE